MTWADAFNRLSGGDWDIALRYRDGSKAVVGRGTRADAAEKDGFLVIEEASRGAVLRVPCSDIVRLEVMRR